MHRTVVIPTTRSRPRDGGETRGAPRLGALEQRLDESDVLRRARKLELELDYDRAVIEGDTDRQRELAPLVGR
ncbi:hypothetical protein [Salinarimonas chemoclinalis]|uniref:hypothetical protein n=1 Tax=Salinarimonas chemoclinalis TaxID=3241599 RepID=UPI00355620EF